MQRIRRLCRAAALLSVFMMLMLVCTCARADESVQVTIPVQALGADCSVELLDTSHHRVQWLDLEKDVPSAFTITCNGLMRFTYTAVVANSDSEEVKYDHTVYTIHVDTYLNGQGEMAYIVSIEDPATPGGKLGMITYQHESLLPEPSPTPSPTPNPTPTPTPPSEYKYLFSFNKVWRGGEHGNSIDWSLYNADGTRRSKGFNKEIVNDDLWRYEAYFTTSMDDCYVLEEPMAGYVVQYENIGAYSEVTDRCHNGGTIINSKIPETGDDTQLDMYLIMLLLTAFSLFLLRRFRMRPAKSKP